MDKQTIPAGNNDGDAHWFVMRDLKRTNARQPAYMMLAEKMISVFTPMTWRLFMEHGRRVRRKVPFMHDLLFVRECRSTLDPIVAKTPTLQYRWLRATYREPMTVPDADMERFIRASCATDTPEYFLPEEIGPSLHGRCIRIIGGPLDGYEGRLLTTRGSKVKRLLVELPGLIAVGVEVSPEYIQLV